MRTVAWFGNIDTITPDWIRQLRDGLGLTALIPDDYLVHHSGFRLPDELLARSPWRDWPSLPTTARHRQVFRLGPSAAPVFAGVVGPQYDDSRLLRLIEEATRQGVEVWAHIGLWGYGGDIVPELGFLDDQGLPIAEDDQQWGVPICPNAAPERAWVAESIQEAVRRYGVAAIDLDHGHFPPLASFTGLFGCCCPRCEAQARSWGYDWRALLTALADLRRGLSALTPARLRRMADSAADLPAFLVALSDNPSLREWFGFRVRTVNEHMRALSEVVHATKGSAFLVDSHLFPPSIAYLCGQEFKTWQDTVDRLTPGWGPVVGWDECQVHSMAAWALRLCRHVPGLTEEAALQVIYRLLGYDALAMPTAIAPLRAGRFPRGWVVAHEIRRAGELLSASKPFLPPYRPTDLPPGEAAALGDALLSVGAAGYVTGGLLGHDVMATMRSTIG